MEESNVNRLNGISNFGLGDNTSNEEVISPIDEIEESLETEDMKKPHKAKVRSAARKAFGGAY